MGVSGCGKSSVGAAFSVTCGMTFLDGDDLRPKTNIDMSAIEPDAARKFANTVAEKGLGWVESPFSGGAPKAFMGEFTLSGDGPGADVGGAHIALKHVSSNYTHMGPSGAGQTTKLTNQLLCGLGFLAVAKATQLALGAGIDAAKIPHALEGGRAESPLQDVLPGFIKKDCRRTGRIENMLQDLNMGNDLARQSRPSIPMTALCAKIHRMLAAAGPGVKIRRLSWSFLKAQKRSLGHDHAFCTV